MFYKIKKINGRLSNFLLNYAILGELDVNIIVRYHDSLIDVANNYLLI